MQRINYVRLKHWKREKVPRDDDWARKVNTVVSVPISLASIYDRGFEFEWWMQLRKRDRAHFETSLMSCTWSHFSFRISRSSWCYQRPLNSTYKHTWVMSACQCRPSMRLRIAHNEQHTFCIEGLSFELLSCLSRDTFTRVHTIHSLHRIDLFTFFLFLWFHLPRNL